MPAAAVVNETDDDDGTPPVVTGDATSSTIVDGFVYPCVKSFTPLPGYSKYAGYTTFIPAPNGEYIAGTIACFKETELYVRPEALVDSFQLDYRSD